jgi:hypothetical protein
VQHLGAVLDEPARDLEALVEVDPAGLTEVLGGHPHREHQGGRRGLHGAGHLADEPRTVLQRSAPGVLAPVVDRAQELRQQVPVGAVQLDAVEARAGAALGGAGEVADDPRDVLLGALAAGVALLVGVRRRAPGHHPADGLRGAQPAVEELRAGEGAALVDARGEAGEPLEHRVVVHAELAGPGLAVLRDVRSAGLDEAEAPVGAGREEAELRLREGAVGVALLVGERGEPDAVARHDTGPELERREEILHRRASYAHRRAGGARSPTRTTRRPALEAGARRRGA